MPTTPQEDKFLKDLSTEFTTNEKGKFEKMTPLEARVYKAVKTEVEKEGQVGRDQIQAVINKELDDAVAEVLAGKSKDGAELPPEEKKTFQQQRAEKTAKNKVNNAVGGVTNQVENRVDRSINEGVGANINLTKLVEKGVDFLKKGPDDHARKLDKQFPDSRLAEIDALAIKAGLPEKSDAIGPMIAGADVNQDNKLDKGELATLIKDPKFKAAAQKVSGVDKPKITTQNDKNDQLDAISVGTSKYVLAEQQAGMRLDDAVVSGEIGAPASTPSSAKPAKGGKGK